MFRGTIYFAGRVSIVQVENFSLDLFKATGTYYELNVYTNGKEAK